MNNSEFIFNFLKEKGCDKVFSIVGGHAMYINAAQHKVYGKDVIYFHNEQSLTLAADSYTRILNRPSIVSVTSAPAALNCLNGVLGAFIDNMPLIIISGQPRSNLNANTINDKLRQYGDQEFSKITDVVETIVKFSKKLSIKDDIEYEISKAFSIAISDRPGPVWIDIPLDVQMNKFKKKSNKQKLKRLQNKLPKTEVPNSKLKFIIDKINNSKRPIIYAGTDISAFDSRNEFLKLVKKLKIPVVTEWNAHDLLSDNIKYCVGRPGLRGDRKGNIIVYKADLILSIGSNLSIRQVGDDRNKFSPNSYKIMVNVDKVELEKPNLSIDLPIYSNIKVFLKKINKLIPNKNKSFNNWLRWCIDLKVKLREFERFKKTNKLNPYLALEQIYKKLPSNKITIIGNGISVVGSFQVAKIKNNDLLYQNVGCASMGYDIPATIGACFAKKKIKKKKNIICITGDGSFQFNFQELQLINHHKLNANIFVINNDGYSSMKQSQSNFTKSIGYHGVDPKSGISFPSLKRISDVYNFKYIKADNIKILKKILNKLNYNKNHIIEIFVDPNIKFEPKVSSTLNNSGKFILDNLYDMTPKIPREKLNSLIQLPKKIS